MKITAEKLTGIDLMRDVASFTIGANSKLSFKKAYFSEHSPIRSQIFVIRMYDIPSFVSTHLVRSKVGVEHFVKSNRDDRGGSTKIDRNSPVNHCMVINAQALITMSFNRLCSASHYKTIEVMEEIKRVVSKIDPFLAKYMVKSCIYRNGICKEFKKCGYNKTEKGIIELAEYLK